MGGKPYSKDAREEIIKLHLEHMRTITSLSKEYGISSSTIYRWLIAERNNSIRRKRIKETHNENQT